MGGGGKLPAGFVSDNVGIFCIDSVVYIGSGEGWRAAPVICLPTLQIAQHIWEREGLCGAPLKCLPALQIAQHISGRVAWGFCEMSTHTSDSPAYIGKGCVGLL